MLLGVFANSDIEIGGHSQSDDFPTRVHVRGADRTGLILYQSLKISDALSGRSTASFTLIDKTAALVVEPGEQVVIEWHGAMLFAGTVDSVRERVPRRGGSKYIELRCVDYVQLLDRFVVAAEYNDATLREIVEDIIFEKTDLWEEGLTVGEVQTGPTIQRAVFNYKTAGSCFRDLADLSGLDWNIDHNKVVKFFDQATYTAPWSLSATEPYTNEIFEKTRRQYRNRQIIRGGQDKTDDRTEEFRGDAVSTDLDKRRRTFTLAFPVGETPTVKRNGGEQRLGVRGVDKDGDLTVPGTTTWPQWFYRLEDKEITQNSDRDQVLNPVLRDDEILEVTYRGFFPMVLDTPDKAEIAARAVIEGGTGEYVHVEEDRDLDGREFGQEKAEELLARFGRIPRILSYDTDKPGLAPGHLQTNTVPEFGLVGIQFLIDTVEITFPRAQLDSLRIRVESLDGQRIDGWSDFYRRQQQAGREFALNKSEILTLVRDIEDTLQISDSLDDSVNGAASLDVFTNDPYTFWLISAGVTVPVSGEIVPTAIIGRSRIGKPHGS